MGRAAQALRRASGSEKGADRACDGAHASGRGDTCIQVGKSPLQGLAASKTLRVKTPSFTVWKRLVGGVLRVGCGPENTICNLQSPLRAAQSYPSPSAGQEPRLPLTAMPAHPAGLGLAQMLPFGRNWEATVHF